MAAEDPDTSDITDRPADPFVSARLPSPGDAPIRTVTLSGLLGDSDRDGRRRLYLNTRLDYYAEFLNDDVIAVEDIAADQPPFVGLDATRVTLKREAMVEYTRTVSAAGVDEFDLDIRMPGVPPSAAAAGTLTNDPTCGGRRTCYTCPGQGTCDTCAENTCGGGTCFFRTCGCGGTGEGTCKTGCRDTCDRGFTCRGTCGTCQITDCDQATCATCRTCPGQTCVTCQTCPGQTCVTCPEQTCVTCQTCRGATCVTCETCPVGTCVTCDTCNRHICWER